MEMDSNNLQELNKDCSGYTPEYILEKSVKITSKNKIVYVCSFGSESAIILHMISCIDKDFPIILLNTKFLFKETIEYKNYLLKKFNLRNFKEVFPNEIDLKGIDGKNVLWKTNPDSCCEIRKVLPLQKELQNYDSWISGRKSYHDGERKGIRFFERINGKIVINPLANVDKHFVNSYFKKNKIKRHPLFESGYLSIGCVHCTVKVTNSSEPRSGRWSNKIKTECGIHYDLNLKK